MGRCGKDDVIVRLHDMNYPKQSKGIMKHKTKSKETARERTTEKEKDMSEVADKAMRNYDQIVRTTLRVQEEASRFWTSLLTQSASAQDWQRPVSSAAEVANGVLPQTQKRMQEVLELAEKNTRAGVELVKKAAEVMQTPGIAERHAKWMDLWASSLGAARSNADGVMQLATRTFDTWIDFVQKSSEVKPA
jgi:hypothetical protein